MKLTAHQLRRAEQEYGLFLLEYCREHPGIEMGPFVAREFFVRGFATGLEKRSAAAIQAECEIAVEDDVAQAQKANEVLRRSIAAQLLKEISKC